MRAGRAGLCLIALGLVLSAASAAPEEQPQAGGDFVQLNLPKTIDLGLLIEYVSRTLNINVMYEETVARQRVSIASPQRIRKTELLPLLRDALKMADLELLDSDVPGWKTIGREAAVRLIPVRHVDAEALAKQAAAVLESRTRMSKTGPIRSIAIVRTPVRATSASAGDVTLIPDARTNQIVVVGTAAAIDRAAQLIQSLDIVADSQTRSYQFRFISPQRVDALIRSHIEAMEPKPRYSGTVDETSGLLIATTKPEVHAQIEALQKTLDTETDPNRSTLQFYKLVNTTAKEVLATIRALYGGAGEDKAKTLAAPGEGRFTGPNRPPTAVGEMLPKPPAYRPDTAATTRPSETGRETLAPEGQNAVVTADDNTNTIIVIAPPDVQQTYRKLIETLDKRRPQVLLEVTLVTLNTTDDFSLGVELGARDTNSAGRVLVFSSFGLSTIDPARAGRALSPGTGFNGILLSPDTVDVVIRALATDSRSRILSAPKLLVNDNATGTLSSVSEEPFTSINASDTVSTTSFAGYASAGTTVDITPHISEGGYLQLKFSVTFSNFTGVGSTGIPPPRQTNSITSDVTIPDGHAVVVGGLTRTTRTEDNSKVPWLGDIPLLKYLFRLNITTYRKATVFAFIRPVVLRDDRFEDLKYLSEEDLRAAELPAGHPCGEPILMK